MTNYFIYTIISLGCSYLVYFALLRKQKTFQFNRFFLIGSLLLCLVAPFLELELFNAVPKINDIHFEPFTKTTGVSEDFNEESFGTVEIVNDNKTSTLLYVYLAITSFLLFRFLRNFLQLFKLIKQPYKAYGKLKLIQQNDTEAVSSFFNFIFVGASYDPESEDHLNIIKHEKVHSDDLHSLDIILIELLMCAFWFNPFLWLYKKSIIQNHEYIADDKSIASGIAIETYANTIINLGQKEYRVPLTSGFNFIQIKNRIIMLHQSKSSVRTRTLKITLTSLLFAVIFTISSCNNLDNPLSEEPLVVVIDAGHGGNDPGQLSGPIQEKDIVLNISNYLKSLSDEKIEIITTRDTDNFTSLEDRIAFINNQKPDLVISLHCNSHTDNTVSGVEAYYFESENEKILSKSRLYSSGLAISLMDEIFNKAKINSSNFKILKGVESPAVLLELGFLTNESDLMQLKNSEKQQEIAQAILEGIMKIEKFDSKL